VGCFDQRESRAKGAKNDAKHEVEPTRVQPSPRATLPNAPLVAWITLAWFAYGRWFTRDRLSICNVLCLPVWLTAPTKTG
jgi:hypothetical protein